MLFILIAYDKPDSLKLRAATRPAHLAYWDQQGPRLRIGGPLLGEDGNPRGSMLVVEAANEAQARRLFDADPYIAAGLFGQVTISPFREVFRDGAQL